jgi:cobalt-zinc-cadmium efflux system protein
MTPRPSASDCSQVRAHTRGAAALRPAAHPHAHDASSDDAHEHVHEVTGVRAAHLGHHGHHDHAHGASMRALRVALVLTAVLLVGEVVGGYLSNSLALLADAGHMFTDVGALALSLFVAWFSRQPAAAEKTYGYLRWEILAALINGATLLGISALILWEAAARFRAPEPVGGTLMLGVAVLGLAVNVVAAWVLHGGAGHSLNHRGAYLHVLGDLLASVGTVGAALVIRTTGWLPIDPIASVLTTLLVVRSAWRLVRESVDVLLEAAPRHISLAAVRERLQAIGGVQSVHDLHVWSVSSGLVAMSAHAVVPDLAEHERALGQIHAAMGELGIGHVTVQLERAAIAACAGD